MSDNLGMAAQLAGQSLRFGWYFALNRAGRLAHRPAGHDAPATSPTRPVPSLQELLADQAQLLMSDALAVRDGLYPPMEDEAASPLGHLLRVRQMLADLPGALGAARRRRCHHRQGRGRRRRRARLLRAGLPFPDRRLSVGGIGAALRHPGRDAVHGCCRPDAPHGAAPDRRVHARARPAPGDAASTSPAARGGSCARCGSPIRP